MELHAESKLEDICFVLKNYTKDSNDICLLSFTLQGTPQFFSVYNRGKGEDGVKLEELNNLKNILFTNTVTKKNTDLLSFMEDNKFNKHNGDGEVVLAYDKKTKTMNFLSIHNSNLGPAVGGLRETAYSDFDSMLTDTLRLSKGMTYKAAIAGTKSGGGKSTRTIPRGTRKDANLGTARIFNYINKKRSLRKVNPYVVGEDSHTTCNDLDQIYEINPNTSCKSLSCGGTGNPSPITAVGVFYAAKAGAEHIFEDKKIQNKTVLLSGIGQVGYEVLKNFIFHDVKEVICAEMNEKRIDWVKHQLKRMNKSDKVRFVRYSQSDLLNQQYLHDFAHSIDIFAPCALGKSINDSTSKALKGSRLQLICGAENNQLADEEKHGRLLHEYGILYVPDYVANAGGILNCTQELEGRIFLIAHTVEKAKQIEDNVRKIIKLSIKENVPPYLAANRLAEKIFTI